ncbi:hypothetical protein BDN70DRAFT_480464 [Pholiota conissans]|uniref:Uncharacterized protein n=1 Tax=Pholiota conissans TaxID=109636 RepID=A0A9P5Z8C7_9AGAR|nr:hypothetical protein BDN70DRAFT_480464 [Pholiota conissans]
MRETLKVGLRSSLRRGLREQMMTMSGTCISMLAAAIYTSISSVQPLSLPGAAQSQNASGYLFTQLPDSHHPIYSLQRKLSSALLVYVSTQSHLS